MSFTDDIFKIEHSSNMKLIPLKQLNNKEYEQFINSYNLDINKFYKVEGKLYPYCYINKTVLVEIYQMSEYYFDNFMVLEQIQQREKGLSRMYSKQRLFKVILSYRQTF